MNLIKSTFNKLVNGSINEQRDEIITRLVKNSFITIEEALLLKQSTLNINIQSLDFEMSTGAKILVNSDDNEMTNF